MHDSNIANSLPGDENALTSIDTRMRTWRRAWSVLDATCEVDAAPHERPLSPREAMPMPRGMGFVIAIGFEALRSKGLTP